MIFTATLTALAAVTFPGGNVSDLAKSIAEATKQGVVIEAGAGERAPRFSFDPSNLNEMARQIQTSTGFRRSPGGEHVFHHGRLGGHLFGVNLVNRLGNSNSWIQGGAVPENFLNDGKVTLQTRSGQSHTLGSLPAGLLNKPLQTHWIFDRAVFKAWVTDMPALDFMNMVAKAIGGKVLQRQDRYVLDIDAAEIQRRAQASLAFVQADRRYAGSSLRDRLEVELSRAALGAIGGAQVNALLATPSGRLQMELPASMRPALSAYIQAVLSDATQEVQMRQSEDRQSQLWESFVREQRRGGGGGGNANRLRMVDPRILGIAEIDARFRVTVQLVTRNQLGQAGPPVRVP